MAIFPDAAAQSLGRVRRPVVLDSVTAARQQRQERTHDRPVASEFCFDERYMHQRVPRVQVARGLVVDFRDDGGDLLFFFRIKQS